MKLNLKDIHSPCANCYTKCHSYSSDDPICQACEYNIAICLIKVMLRFNEGCPLCKNSIRLGGGYFDCKLTENGDCICDAMKDYVFDWQEVFKDYEVNFDN